MENGPSCRDRASGHALLNREPDAVKQKPALGGGSLALGERSSSVGEHVLADIWLSTSAVEVTPREGRGAQLPAKPRANTRRPHRGDRQGLQ